MPRNLRRIVRWPLSQADLLSEPLQLGHSLGQTIIDRPRSLSPFDARTLGFIVHPPTGLRARVLLPVQHPDTAASKESRRLNPMGFSLLGFKSSFIEMLDRKLLGTPANAS